MPTSRSESAQVIYKPNCGRTLKFCHNLFALFLRMIVELPSQRGVKSSLPRCVEVDSIIFWKITT
jgi:hypothetical protein